MSGEFREASGYYFHSLLESVEPEGDQRLSKILYSVYKALAPLENAAAYVEAGDSCESECIVQASLSAPAVREACHALIKYCNDQEDLAQRLIKNSLTKFIGDGK
jgi:hypothetical protein